MWVLIFVLTMRLPRSTFRFALVALVQEISLTKFVALVQSRSYVYQRRMTDPCGHLIFFLGIQAH